MTKDRLHIKRRTSNAPRRMLQSLALLRPQKDISLVLIKHAFQPLLHYCACAITYPKSTLPLIVHFQILLCPSTFHEIVAIGDNIGQSSWLAKACTNSPSSSCHEMDSETPDDIGDVATAEDKGTTS